LYSFARQLKRYAGFRQITIKKSPLELVWEKTIYRCLAVLRRPIVRARRPLSQGGMGAVRIRSGSAWKNRVSLRRILSRLGKAQTSLALRSLLQNLPPTKRGCTRNANGLGDCTGGGCASPAGCAGETPTTSAKVQ